jgi:hypothetical protein
VQALAAQVNGVSLAAGRGSTVNRIPLDPRPEVVPLHITGEQVSRVGDGCVGEPKEIPHSPVRDDRRSVNRLHEEL